MIFPRGLPLSFGEIFTVIVVVAVLEGDEAAGPRRVRDQARSLAGARAQPPESWSGLSADAAGSGPNGWMRQSHSKEADASHSERTRGVITPRRISAVAASFTNLELLARLVPRPAAAPVESVKNFTLMPIRTALWKVGPTPQPLAESTLQNEQLLERMIVATPRLVSDEWMLIGRQEDTGFGGRIDLLAIAPDGAIVLIELKRNRTPREVVAQALDYAAWVERLKAEDIDGIYRRFAPGRSLADDFRQRFGEELDEDTLNDSHQIVIVASSLDDSSERIVSYLSDRDIAINVLCFQVFSNGNEQILSRAWLLDPIRSQVSAAAAPTGPAEPWNGEFYASFGDGPTRSWRDAVEYGFICGGGGAWYSRTLQLLSPGDRVWVKVPGSAGGFVGVGHVTGSAQPAKDFCVSTAEGQKPVLDVATRGTYHRELVNDPERCEYFVPVRWLQTVPREKAVQEVGFFGNQNTVCKPTTQKWRSTVDRLKQIFPAFDQ